MNPPALSIYLPPLGIYHDDREGQPAAEPAPTLTVYRDEGADAPKGGGE